MRAVVIVLTRIELLVAACAGPATFAPTTPAPTAPLSAPTPSPSAVLRWVQMPGDPALELAALAVPVD